MTNNGRDARWCGDNAVIVNVTQHPAQQGGHYDGYQHRRMNIAGSEDRDDKEAQHAQQHVMGGQVTNADQRLRVSDDNTGIFQPHHTDEQTDTAGDTHAQADRNVSNHPVTHAENSQQQQTNRAPEDSAHADLPRQPHRLNYYERKECVKPHRRSQRNRQVSEYAHQNAAKCSDQAGGHEDGAGIHASNAQNLWVNKNDIDHRQEGGKTGDHFGACRCAVLAQFKHALKQTLTRCLGCVLLTHHQFPNKEGKFVAILYQNATIVAVTRYFFH